MSQLNQHDFHNSIKVGHVWSVRKGPFTHVGLETSRGTIISASPYTNGVAEISKNDFAGSQIPKYIGYPGYLSPAEVEARAFNLVGMPYSFWRDNCEHLVTTAHGLKKQSPQLKAWAMAGVVCLIGFAVLSAVRNTRA